MTPTRRKVLKLGAIGTIGAVAGCTEADTGASAQNETETATTTVEEQDEDTQEGRRVTVEQGSDKTFYWVLPGERRLSPHVFGTPDAPRHGTDLLQSRIEQARGLPDPLGDAIPQLLQDLPVLVAAPEARKRANRSTTISPREVRRTDAVQRPGGGDGGRVLGHVSRPSTVRPSRATRRNAGFGRPQHSLHRSGGQRVRT